MDQIAIDRAAIQAAYDKINSAFVDNDLDSVMTLFTTDYTQTDPHGRILDFSGLRKKFQGLRNQIITAHIDCSIKDISVGPDGDMVDMNSLTIGTGAKRVLFMKVKGSFTNNLVVHDLWVHTASGWQIKSRQTLVDVSHVQQG
jgi:ketosteroid isomerase-like protein